MSRTPRRQVDPVEHEIENALEPGRFISDGACFSFVSGLDEVAATIGKLIPSDADRAVRLHEAFLAGCYQKAEELDDSSGSFGQFVNDLFCGWIKARQAARANPDDTANRLLAFMERDPYGFSYGLEKEAAKAFDKAGLAAFEKRVRARFEAVASAKPSEAGSLRDAPGHRPRRWATVLRSLFLAQRNVPAYVALSEQTGLTAQDCRSIATMLIARRRPEDALAWVERGIDIEKKSPRGGLAGDDLTGLRRVLLSKLGRGGEALESAWAEYRKHPSRFAYDDLMRFVPKTERTAWHEKAMDTIEGSDLHSVIELLLETKEMERLADRVRRSQDDALERVSHHVTEPVAKKLEKLHPDLAARLWRAQGMRIIDAKKSKYYEAALSNFERAMRCYERAGLTADWEETVNEVRTRHCRKTGFMPGFDRLLAGSGPSAAPSFLERAKARWAGEEKEGS